METTIDVGYYLPKILQNDVWLDFTQALSTELQLAKNQQDEKLKFFDIEYQAAQGNIDNLLALGQQFGYNIDISLNQDPTYVKKILYMIPYIIKNKTRYSNYDLFMKLGYHYGTVYTLTWDGNRLLRAMDDFVPTLEAARIGGTLQNNIQIVGSKNYFIYASGDNYLDLTPPLTLDSSLVWYLDQSLKLMSTKHLAIEYFIGSFFRGDSANTNLIVKNSTEYLMTSEFMEYLSNSVDYNRKLIEIPHVGCALNLIMDSSGKIDSVHTGNTYTFPNIKTNCFVTKNFNSNANLFIEKFSLVIGNPLQLGLPQRTYSDFYPTSGSAVNSLSNEILSVPLTINEVIDRSDINWQFYYSTGNPNLVKEKIATGDGVTTSFSGRTTYYPLTPRTVKFLFSYRNFEKEVIDLYQDCIGFYTNENILTQSQTDLAFIDSVNSIEYTLSKFNNSNIVSGSVIMTYTYNGVEYVVNDSSIPGSFLDLSGNISSSIIDYSTGKITVIFSITTDPSTSVTFSYQYNSYNTYTLTKSAYADINYETGDYKLYTQYQNSALDIVPNSYGITSLSFNLSYVSQGKITPGSVSLNLYTGGGVQYTITDTPDSNTTHISGTFNSFSSIVTGTITYATGLVSLTFVNPTSYIQPVSISYIYTTLFPPDTNTDISIEYVTTQPMEISEVGLKDSSGNVIAYASFPPIQLGDIKYHAAFNWLIYKGTF